MIKGIKELLKIRNIVSTLFLTEVYYDLDTVKDEFLHLFQYEPDREAVSLFFNWFRHLALQGRVTERDYAALEDHMYQNEEEVAMLVETIREEKRQMYQQGKREGKREGRCEVAHAMLLKGLPIQLIAEITGLSSTEIQQNQTETVDTPQA